jgi:hypothetical protein
LGTGKNYWPAPYGLDKTRAPAQANKAHKVTRMTGDGVGTFEGRLFE